MKKIANLVFMMLLATLVISLPLEARDGKDGRGNKKGESHKSEGKGHDDRHDRDGRNNRDGRGDHDGRGGNDRGDCDHSNPPVESFAVNLTVNGYGGYTATATVESGSSTVFTVTLPGPGEWVIDGSSGFTGTATVVSGVSGNQLTVTVSGVGSVVDIVINLGVIVVEG